jgi:L-ascorbate metabolism protein UlaG (beta-lactamase superfamily)
MKALTVLRYIFVFLATALLGCSTQYQGPATDHFDGKVFSNPGQVKDSSVAGYLWLRLTTAQGKWPESVPLVAQPPPPLRLNDGTARVTWVGHATLLIQVAGLNILTDPVWSERASPISFIGPKRVTPAAIELASLPPIDIVLISHNHYDHLDIVTLENLSVRDKPKVIVPLGNKALVSQAMPASEVTEHDWGAKISLGDKGIIHVEPLVHGSGRSPFDQMQTLWAAYVIEIGGLKIYYAGDTGYGDGSVFKASGTKFSGFDMAILPIGAYEPQQFMSDSHISPADAVVAMQDLRAKRALAHHYGTFQLGFESFDAPLQSLRAALAAKSLSNIDFASVLPGEFVTVDAVKQAASKSASTHRPLTVLEQKSN